MQNKIIFNSFDGTKLVGIIQKPNNIKPKGGFLLMHGIPSEKNEWGFYSDMASFLEEKGYVSLRFDFRCNGESEGGDLQNLTLSEMVNDIDAAYSQLIKTYEGNIYVVGTSCGGGVSIRWVNDFGRKIKQIFLMAPVLDYLYEVSGLDQKAVFDLDDVVSDQIVESFRLAGNIGGEIPYGLAMLNEARIFRGIDEFRKLSNETIIFQGNADTVVPIEKTRSIAATFPEKIKLIEIGGADHGFAVQGDDDLTAEGTKQNHYNIYNMMVERMIY